MNMADGNELADILKNFLRLEKLIKSIEKSKDDMTAEYALLKGKINFKSLSALISL